MITICLEVSTLIAWTIPMHMCCGERHLWPSMAAQVAIYSGVGSDNGYTATENVLSSLQSVSSYHGSNGPGLPQYGTLWSTTIYCMDLILLWCKALVTAQKLAVTTPTRRHVKYSKDSVLRPCMAGSQEKVNGLGDPKRMAKVGWSPCSQELQGMPHGRGSGHSKVCLCQLSQRHSVMGATWQAKGKRPNTPNNVLGTPLKSASTDPFKGLGNDTKHMLHWMIAVFQV